MIKKKCHKQKQASPPSEINLKKKRRKMSNIVRDNDGKTNKKSNSKGGIGFYFFNMCSTRLSLVTLLLM